MQNTNWEAPYDPSIQPHQQTTVAKIFSTRADVASGEHFKEDPIWQRMQQSVYVAACHFTPMYKFYRQGLTWSQIYM